MSTELSPTLADLVALAEQAVIREARELNLITPDRGDGDPMEALDDAIVQLDDALRAALAESPARREEPGLDARVRHAADNILDRTHADPDDDAVILARFALKRLASRG